MTNERVAAIVVQMRDGIPLILTHLPAKSQGPDDYSVTTITGHLGPRENGYSAMANAVSTCLGFDRACITDERSLTQRPMESKNKLYFWYLMMLDPGVRITPLKSEIEKFDWNHPAQLPHALRQMSTGRRDMFVQALTTACKEKILDYSQFPFLRIEPSEGELQMELKV